MNERPIPTARCEAVQRPEPASPEQVADMAARRGSPIVICSRRSQAIRVFRQWQRRGIQDAIIVTNETPRYLFDAMLRLVQARLAHSVPAYAACTAEFAAAAGLDPERVQRAMEDAPGLVLTIDIALPDKPVQAFLPDGSDATGRDGSTAPPDHWRESTRISGGIWHDYVLDAPNGLQLTAVQTRLRSETSDRAYDICLYSEKNGLRYCLWHREAVPETPGKLITETALDLAMAYLNAEAAKAASLRDALASMYPAAE